MKKNWMALSAAAVFALAYSATASAARQNTRSRATGDKTRAQTRETKHEGKGMKTTKSKVQRVFGTVKSYDAGKKLVVTGPKNKDYSYDLDDKDMTANVDPAVAVGGKVKVVKSTDDAGKVTLTVSPHTASTMHHKGMKKSTTTKSTSTTESSPSTK